MLRSPRMQVNDEASMKVLEVEMEYNRRRKPVYEKRARLIRDIEQFWLHVFMQVRLAFLALKASDAVTVATNAVLLVRSTRTRAPACARM